MVKVRLTIEGEAVEVETRDARAAVSVIRGLLHRGPDLSFGVPEVSTANRKSKFVADETKKIFETLRGDAVSSGVPNPGRKERR